MEDKILENLGNPGQLERLYRSDKQTFKKAFSSVYPQYSDNSLLSYWNERLNFRGEDLSVASKDLLFVIVLSLTAGILAKIPAIFSIDEEFFYSRNIGFIVFPVLCVYLIRKNNLSLQKILIITGSFLTGLLFINLLPDSKKSDTLVLSCMHLVLFLWSVTGFAFTGKLRNSEGERLSFLKFNGDLVVISVLIGISGVLLTAITMGLFSVIKVDIETFYLQYVVVFGLAAIPVVGTYLTRLNPQIVGKVSPLIAKIFSPLVLVMLVSYLIAMGFSGKDPYNDREFLIIFNLLLIGVMALIFFSVAENFSEKHKRELMILFLLSAVTIVVNSIALSAILFRITEWGMTPNRAAVLGSNVLILINLLLVAYNLFKVINNKTELKSVGKSIAIYLPVYVVWTIIVTFVFPFIFGFR